MAAVDQLSTGPVFAGDYTARNRQVVYAVAGTILRSNTVAKVLGVIPGGSTIVNVKFLQTAQSDAGTTAVLDMGFSDGTGKELISDADVKGGSNGQQANAAFLGLTTSTDHTITGKYAETGSASTVGGPWIVVVQFVTNILP